MLKLLSRACLLLTLFGVAAISARADQVPAGSGSGNDFKVILNDPSCPSGNFCADIGYTGPSQYVSIFNPVIFWSPSATPIPTGQTAACASNFLSYCYVIQDDNDGDIDLTFGPDDPATVFYGVAYWGGMLSTNEDLTVGVSGTSLSLLLPNNFQCDNNACPNGVITLTPEPSTILLLMSGLLVLAFFRRCAKVSLRRAESVI